MKSPLFGSILTLFVLISCNQVGNKNNSKVHQSDSINLKNIVVENDSTRIKDSLKIKEEARIRSNFIIGQKYNIQGVNIIQKEPSLNSEKLINKKASEISRETVYARVDCSTTVRVDDINGYWVKIKLMEPEWLSKTHEGWILASNIIGEDKTDRHFISNLTKSFLVSLLKNINSKQYIDSILKKLNFHEESHGFYKSNDNMKHIININDLTDMVIIHSSDSIFWKKIYKEFKGIQKQEVFYEGSYIGKRYIDGKITFETLKPKNGIDVEKNVFYDLYVYRTKNHK